jgi:SEC-C motif
MTVGRNDPCTCGSGKKYKKCCLAAQELSKTVDFTYQRLRHVEAQLIPRLMRHAAEIFGPEAFHAAWDEFNNYETEVGFDPKAPMNQAFMPWFLFMWTEVDPEKTVKIGAPIDTTVAESFLEADDRQLSADEKMILNAANRRPFSFCEVVAIHSGTGMRLRDLLSDGEFEVNERTASQSLQVGHIIFCATMYLANRFSNIATAPYPLPPIYKKDVLKLRKFIESDVGKKALRFEDILVSDGAIRETYLDIVRQLFNPNIKLHNTDGDPLIPQKVMFQIEDPDFAFHKLRTYRWDPPKMS